MLLSKIVWIVINGNGLIDVFLLAIQRYYRVEMLLSGGGGGYIVYGMEGELGSLYIIHTYTNTLGNIYLLNLCIFY